MEGLQMGAWGTGIFENDEACDFTGTVAESDGLSALEIALDRVLNAGSADLEAREAEEGLGAADIVARLAGQFGERTAYTEEIDEWVERQKSPPTAALLEKARLAITRVLSKPSELLDLWAETEHFVAWKSAIEELSKRLQSAATDKG
ncbi:MAG: DUF4259 domain-containing protein [Hyphomicrobiales bacterium]